MKVYFNRTNIKRNNSIQGESLEKKLERIIANKEPIKDGSPIIYTERKDGIQPSYNIRTDRFEVALDGLDKIHKSQMAKREERAKLRVVKEDGKAEPTQGTGTEN